MERHSISLLNDYYGALLTKKQREMLELFYNRDLSLGELAGQFGVSRQAVRDAIRRGETALQMYEEKLGLLKKNTQLLKESKLALNHFDNNERKNARESVKKIIKILED